MRFPQYLKRLPSGIREMDPICPFKFRMLKKVLSRKKANVLDVGCGNHSPTITKRWFPNCNYYGLDKALDYNLSPRDFDFIEQFYQIDLTTLDFNIVPDDFFDVIIMSHVIEHIVNGDEVIRKLIPKLKQKGKIYIEFPSPSSVNFPSKIGTLNFYDDKTHLRLFSLNEVSNILINLQLRINKSGTRRDIYRILLFPIYSIFSLLLYRHVVGGVYWDVYGFAEFVLAEKI